MIGALVVIVIVIDQISKYYIQSQMSLGKSIAVIPNVFHITYILNPGAAFGMFEHKVGFFIAVALGMVGGIIFLYPRIVRMPRLFRVGTGLLAGGALGNVIDRLRLGYVVDFFDFRKWPVFNIADMAIVVGVTFIIYTLLFLLEEEGDFINR